MFGLEISMQQMSLEKCEEYMEGSTTERHNFKID